jgi:fructose-1,6-bisphosphatase/inositol monophosphatase family enzyme
MQLEKIFVDALQASYEMHEKLGKAGEELIQTNQFGDLAVLADIKCEEAVLGVLRERKLPIKVISEEHGLTQIGDEVQYTGILDGIDGSSVYKKARGEGRYGTMFAIFEGDAPTYGDYLVCGIMQHATGRMYVAEKGKGAYVMEEGAKQPLYTSAKTHLAGDVTLYVDESFEYNRRVFSSPLSEFHPKYEGASSLYYAALAEGGADVVLECTRKGNLEIAVEYGLTCEAGGAVIDLDGQDIGSYRYSKFGQATKEGVISAATKKLALEVLKKIR